MTNEQIISKMKEDMKMRGFSHWTEESYLLKTKDIMKYFRKPTFLYIFFAFFAKYNKIRQRSCDKIFRDFIN